MRIYKLENLNIKNMIFNNLKKLTNKIYTNPVSIKLSNAIFTYTTYASYASPESKQTRGIYYLVSGYSLSIFLMPSEIIELYNILNNKVQCESNFGRTSHLPRGKPHGLESQATSRLTN